MREYAVLRFILLFSADGRIRQDYMIVRTAVLNIQF
jgi:hypothetical protein